MSMPVETSDWGSRSTTRVRRPRAKAAEARPSVTVVLPTPPLRELTLSTCTSRDDTFTTVKKPKSCASCGTRGGPSQCWDDFARYHGPRGPDVQEDPRREPW